jgi:hypothetical protein
LHQGVDAVSAFVWEIENRVEHRGHPDNADTRARERLSKGLRLEERLFEKVVLTKDDRPDRPAMRRYPQESLRRALGLRRGHARHGRRPLIDRSGDRRGKRRRRPIIAAITRAGKPNLDVKPVMRALLDPFDPAARLHALWRRRRTVRSHPDHSANMISLSTLLLRRPKGGIAETPWADSPCQPALRATQRQLPPLGPHWVPNIRRWAPTA